MTTNDFPDAFDQRVSTDEDESTLDDFRSGEAPPKTNGAAHAAPTVDPLEQLAAREAERQDARNRDRDMLVDELRAVDARRAHIVDLLRVFDGERIGAEGHKKPEEKPVDLAAKVFDWHEAKAIAEEDKATKRSRVKKPDDEASETDEPVKLSKTLQRVCDWLKEQKPGGSAKDLAEHMGFKGPKASVKASGLFGELRKRGLAENNGQRPATWRFIK